jgi:hypothetical protein
MKILDFCIILENLEKTQEHQILITFLSMNFQNFDYYFI